MLTSSANAARCPPERGGEARALAATAVSVAGSTAPAGATVCAYVPVGSEPGSIEMLDALRAAGLRVLLPVTVTRPARVGRVHGRRRAGRGGPRTAGTHRSGVAGRRGRVRVRDLRPGARRGRAGTRLGRGAGFYDRTLGCADPGAALVAVVRDCELVPTLPADPHDVRMHYALTPGRGLVRLRDE
ncbi:5-formyltetrahydrofolate cyclo-ligase [Rhodococcus hoagii]|nr:5-formyltetrahydrofolate cyclo-ligase [Prescottella equi]